MLKLADGAVRQKPRRVVTHRGGNPLLTKAEKLKRQRDRAKKWRAANRERLRQYFADYRAAHPELKGYHAEYFKSHREAFADRSRRADVRAKAAEWRRATRAERREGERRWRAGNPDRDKAIGQRTREKQR